MRIGLRLRAPPSYAGLGVYTFRRYLLEKGMGELGSRQRPSDQNVRAVL